MTHILSGIDHLLFVAGLLFLVGFRRRLVGTITAFTLAHSLTLASSALGWITLNDQLLPTRFLHASYGNVLAMLETMGNPMSMPPAQVQTYLARGFGRVLAHELGHYLLASNAHAKRGLMQASLSPEMLFGPGRATLKMPTTVCDALHN